MKNFNGLAAAAAVTLLSASAATAATVSFVGTTGPDVASLSGATGVGSIGYTVTANVDGIENDVGLVSQNLAGLGVNGYTPGSTIPDTEPGLIDASIFSGEGLTVTFDSAVNLDSFTLGEFSTVDYDDYALYINGVLYGNQLTAATLPIDLNGVTSFSVFAVYDGLSDSHHQQGGFGNDEFTLASFSVSAVPLPATALLLLSALGGLGFAKRRRRRA